MRDFSQYKVVGKTSTSVSYIMESDPDILIMVPAEGMVDTGENAHESVEFMYAYARSLGRKCSTVIIMENVISQEPEARRVYANVDLSLYYAAALVVESALSRALASFFIGLSRPAVTTKLFNSMENAIEWLKTMRPINPEE